MQTWKNGEDADVVRKIINQNFETLSYNLGQTMRSLSTEARLEIPTEYLKDDLIVYDTTLDSWYKFDTRTGWQIWSPSPRKFSINFYKSDWEDKTMEIKQSEHHIANPVVTLYKFNGDEYESVLGGVYIESDHTVILRCDTPFDGKVVMR